MAKQNINSKEGFTIIEVVLVLAIAGLIFLMVFVALPALQRSQRDNARRQDMSRVDTSLVQYQTNHSTSSNNLPNGPSYWDGTDTFGSDCTGKIACEFVRDYMNTGSASVDGTKKNEFTDPDGVPYSVAITKNVASLSNLGDAAMTPANWKSKLALKGDYLTIEDNGGNAFDQHAVYIVPGGQCNDDTVVKSTTRHFAILYRLEGAGVYCIDDQ